MGVVFLDFWWMFAPLFFCFLESFLDLSTWVGVEGMGDGDVGNRYTS